MTTEIDKDKAVSIIVPKKMATQEKDKDKEREKDKDKDKDKNAISNACSSSAAGVSGTSAGSSGVVPSGGNRGSQSHSTQVVMNQDAPNILVYKKVTECSKGYLTIT